MFTFVINKYELSTFYCMKKIYFTLLISFYTIVSLTAQPAPACSINPIFIVSKVAGIWSGSASKVISSSVTYEQNITDKASKDTSTGFGERTCFNRFEISSLSSVINFIYSQA